MNTPDPATQQWNERCNATASPLGDTAAMFRLLFERSADAMSLLDPEVGRLVEANDAFARQVGVPGGKHLNNVALADVSPTRQPDGRLSSEKAADMVRRALANGSHRFEWLFRRDDGVELPLDIVMTVVPCGGRAMVFVVSRDISAQKKAEQDILLLNASLEQRVGERAAALLEANDRLTREVEERRRQEAIQDRRAGQMQRHRDVLLELVQTRKSDFGAALLNLCSRATAALDVARVSYWSLRDDGSAIVCELLYLRDGGTTDDTIRGARLAAADSPAYFTALGARRPVVADDVLTHPATSGLSESYLKPLGITSMLDAPVWVRGEVVGVLCHEHTGPRRDWTAEEVDFVSALAALVSLALEESQRAQSERLLRESEEKFRALFEATSQGVILHDEEKMLEVNPAAIRILGYRSASELIGKHPAEPSAPIQPSGELADTLARRHIAACMDCGSARFEWLARSPNGRHIPIEVILTRIQWSGRQLIQAIINDITERKLAENELLKTLAREKELGQLRSNFVSMVSHEFRTPLGIIQSSAEILDDYFDRLDTRERQEHLDSIQKNTRRMAALMEEVLLIGSFDAGKMEFKPAPLDLHQFARLLVDEVHSATERRCPVQLALEDLPGSAHADKRLLRHLLSNLLTNAVKYSNPGCPVHLQLIREGAEAVCRIRDEGIGIPDADREWLFSAFHRGQNVGDRPGTGLGLVIVKRCVDLHGGSISVESVPGQGTTMTVRLPVFAPSSRSTPS